jgi:hypothetical protein
LLVGVIVRMGRVHDVVAGDGRIADAGEVEGPAQTADDDEVVGAGRSHGVVERLHARDFETVAARSAVAPDVPRDVVRFVVELEEDAAVVLVLRGERLPECDRARVGHALLTRCRAGVCAIRPVKIEDDVHAEPFGPANRQIDDALVARRVVGTGQPEGLVQREPDDVRVPCLHQREVLLGKMFARRVPFERGAAHTSKAVRFAARIEDARAFDVVATGRDAARGVAAAARAAARTCRDAGRTSGARHVRRVGAVASNRTAGGHGRERDARRPRRSVNESHC